MGMDLLTDSRLGSSKQHLLVPQLRQSIYSRLAGYEDVIDAERLAVDPAMRHVVGGRVRYNYSAGGRSGRLLLGERANMRGRMSNVRNGTYGKRTVRLNSNDAFPIVNSPDADLRDPVRSQWR